LTTRPTFIEEERNNEEILCVSVLIDGVPLLQKLSPEAHLYNRQNCCSIEKFNIELKSSAATVAK